MLDSLKRNRKGIALMILSSICACIGQLFWKLAMGNSKMLFYLGIGFFMYGIGAFVMLIAYRFGKLSVLQPMLSLNYIVTILLGAFVLNETITYLKMIGILVIMFGVILIGGGDET